MDRVDIEDYKRELKTKWRDNQRLISLIIVFAFIGLVIAGINNWHFNQTTSIFTLEEPQTIDQQNDAVFSFEIDNPTLDPETTILLEIENLDSDSDIYISVNGEEIEEITSSSTTVDIPPEVLENNNEVRIYESDIDFQQQELVYAEVTSSTNIQQIIFFVLNLSALALIFTPLGYVKYQEFVERKKIEQQFPSFLRDVVQGTRAGMPLTQAIQNTQSGDYGPLNKYIDRMSAQIEWGVPFDEVLDNFGKSTGSPIVKRSSDTIIQAYTSGGDIEEVLESVGDNIRSIKKIKEERQSQLYGEMVTGYMVYFIFIGILIALMTFLLPNLAEASDTIGGDSMGLFDSEGGDLEENISLYEVWFSRLVYLQAIFSGLIIGKLSEGQLKAGIKHSAILFIAGYLSLTLFI